MTNDYQPGGPPGNERGSTGVEPQSLLRHKDSATPAAESNHDCWLERYLTYLCHEATMLGGGQIAWHYIGCASAAYAEFSASGSTTCRYRAWLGIRTACQWLAQLRRAAA